MKTKLTLPTIDELDYKPHLVSDFAIATGAAHSSSAREIGNKKGRTALVWLRTHYHDDKMAETHNLKESLEYTYKREKDADFVEISNFMGNLYYANAGRHSICVMPVIENPEGLGFGIMQKANSKESFLTNCGNLAFWPKAYAGDELSAKLESFYQHGQLLETGAYTTDATEFDHFAFSNSLRSGNDYLPFKPQENKEYLYGKEHYVRVEMAHAQYDAEFDNGSKVRNGEACWFKSEPIHAYRRRDGKIQIKDPLLAMSFEPQGNYYDKMQGATNADSHAELNLAEFNIGKYLNGTLLPELVLSAARHNSAIHEQQCGSCASRQNCASRQDTERSL